jgi:ATP-binding cassette subfamily B protein
VFPEKYHRMIAPLKLIEPIQNQSAQNQSAQNGSAQTNIQAKIDQALGPDEEVLIRVFSDIKADHSFGRQWLVATRQRVLVVPEDDKPITEVAFKRMTVARTEALVSAARLEIEQRDGPNVQVPYSNSMGTKFSEVARGLEQLRKNEDFLIKTELERTRCAKCNRLLPEKDGLCPACVSRLTTLKRLIAYLKPYKSRALALGSASIIMTLAELLPPAITKYLIDFVLVPVFAPEPETNPESAGSLVDSVLESSHQSASDAAAVTTFFGLEGDVAGYDNRLALLGILVLGLVLVRTASWAAEWVHAWNASWLGARVTADIRSILYRRLEMLSLQFYDKRQVGSLMSRVTRDSGMLQDFLVEGLPYMVIEALMILGILGFLFFMNWKLTLFVLVPIPILWAWGVYFWRRMRRYFHKLNHSWSHITARLNEALSGIRVVKAFAQEPRELREFDKRNEKLMDIGIASERNWYVFFSTMGLVTGLGVVIVWLFGGQAVMADEMTLGDLIAFYSYMWLLYGPIQWFGQVNSWMTRAFAGAERIFEVIDTQPEAYDDPNAIAMPQLNGAVSFKDTTFGYDKSKPVLHNITLDVKAGEMIGLVGKSGVGKTTMINLIARFYDIDHGSIAIDGVDIRNIRLQDLRRQIGIVLQEPFLFSGSIAENIGYGKPDASFQEVMDAARAANAHNFIMAKPDSYNTQVGERGGGLSGGERQRVSIARAVLHNPRILILDEATSSVDVETEKLIQDAIGCMIEGRTTFAIAHRLSTLRNADRLVVLDAGKIVEVGTHAELLEKQGTFAELVELQKKTSEIIAIKE